VYEHIVLVLDKQEVLYGWQEEHPLTSLGTSKTFEK
jgi:hypothetical protein